MRHAVTASFCALLMVLGLGLGLGLGTANADEQELEGYVTDDMCGAEHMMEGMNNKQCADECVGMGAKYALFVPSEKKIYAVANQEKIKPFAGEDVLVKGTVSGDGKTVTVTTVTRR
jgi:hypothetical protein